MPKSSIDRHTPSALKRRTFSSTSSASSISRDSVSSSSRREGSRPESASAWVTLFNRSPRRNCTAERLTAMVSSGNPACCQRTAWAQASRSTHSPMGTMSPLSSAVAMKRPGGSSSSGLRCQRTKASTPTTWPLARSICGW